MKALIVDDERLARSELRRLLKEHPHIEVIGEAANAEEALRAIKDLSPDLLFLDIQMPGKSGFDLIQELSHLPKIIFTTAFDKYALRAFEFHAFDYLLKPIEASRLASSLQGLQSNIPENFATVSDSQDGTHLIESDHVFLRDGARCLFVKAGNIRMFESEGNYSRVYHDNEKLLIYRSLSSIGKRLDPALFYRASRTHIINLKQIENIEVRVGRLLVSLQGGLSVEMSRRQSQLFKQLRSF